MALSMAVIVLYGGMIWYVFPEVDKTISWEGHLAGLITGFVFAVRFKTPDYVKDIQFEWEKPDFNPELDPFMKHFDENGYFVNTPQPEEEVLDDIKELLFKHYVKINNIFLYYIGISTYPTISMNDFTSWA
jgi:hypothetical protein